MRGLKRISPSDWILVGILCAAAFLRLYKIRDYMTFLGDEGRDVLVVKHLLLDHDIPFIGPTASVAAFFLGPLYYYMMAPFLWIFRLDPVGPAIMVALFGVATVYLLYKVAKEWYGTFAAVCASMLYALSPLVIAQSRSSWNPNVVPFFALLYIYSLHKAIKTNKKVWYFLAGACIGAGIQFHYLYLFLIPISLVALFYHHTKKDIKNWISFIGGALVPLIPFLGFEIKNSFPNIHTIIRFLTAGKEVSYMGHPFMTVGDIMFRLFARLIFFYPGPDQYYRFSPVTLLWAKIGIIATIILSVGLIAYRSIKYKKPEDILLLAWFIAGTTFFVFYQKAIYDYYLVIIFPLPFLLLGILFERWWQKKAFQPLVIIVIILLLILNYSGRPFQYAPNRQADQVEAAARAVADAAGGQPFNFALITGGNSDHAYRYFLELMGKSPVTIENFEKDPNRTSVTNQLIVICEIGDCHPLGYSLWEVAGFGQAEIVGHTKAGPLDVYKLVHTAH